MSDAVAGAILAAEQRRADAMLANDAAALAALLDDRLQFNHATGLVDGKAAYLAKMAAGRITYLSVVWSEERVVTLGQDAALLTGRMLTTVQVDGTDKELDNRVIAAWAHSGYDWRLVAFQSTPIRG